MKKLPFILASMIFACTTLAGDYVVFSRETSFWTKGIELKVLPGDCLRYGGKNDTGAWISALAGNCSISMPWHDVKIVAGTPEAEARYGVAMKRLSLEFRAALAQRDAQQRMQAARAAAAAEYAASPDARIDDLERRLAASERAAQAADAQRQWEAQEAARRAQNSAVSAEVARQQEQWSRDWQQQQRLQELERKLRNR